MVLVDFRSFGGILFDVVAFLGLIRCSSFSISDKPTLLNEKLGILFNLLLISKALGWFLYLFMFSTKLISLLIVRFSEKKGCIFFQKLLLSLILLEFRLSKYFFRSFL